MEQFLVFETEKGAGWRVLPYSGTIGIFTRLQGGKGSKNRVPKTVFRGFEGQFQKGTRHDGV